MNKTNTAAVIAVSLLFAGCSRSEDQQPGQAPVQGQAAKDECCDTKAEVPKDFPVPIHQDGILYSVQRQPNVAVTTVVGKEPVQAHVDYYKKQFEANGWQVVSPSPDAMFAKKGDQIAEIWIKEKRWFGAVKGAKPQAGITIAIKPAASSMALQYFYRVR